MNGALVQFGDMAGFITALTGEGGLTSANLWAQITAAAGFIASIAIFAFGVYIVRKIIKGAGKGKIRM